MNQNLFLVLTTKIERTFIYYKVGGNDTYGLLNHQYGDRFESAVGAAEKARKNDIANSELNSFTVTVKSVARARSLGNELFNSGKFLEASLAYGEGLRHDPSNPVLYCNRAACRYKLGQWEKSIEDCNEALRIQPNYTKALLRRAASYAKVGTPTALLCCTLYICLILSFSSLSFQKW